MVLLAKERFPQVEQLYEAHFSTELPLKMMKIELDKNMKSHMPLCQMEELGGYAPLTKDEINGNEPLINQPKWRLALIKLHNKALLEYAAVPRNRLIDPTYCPIKNVQSNDNIHGSSLI